MDCPRCGSYMSRSDTYCWRCKSNEEKARATAAAGAAAAERSANEAAAQRRIAQETQRLTEQKIKREEKENEEKEARYKWEHRECPECAEMVKKKAKRCIHCQFEFTDRDSFAAKMKEEEELANRFNCHPWEGRHALERYEEQEKQRKIEEKKERERRQKRANDLGCSVDELDGVEAKLKEEEREKRIAELRSRIYIDLPDLKITVDYVESKVLGKVNLTNKMCGVKVKEPRVWNFIKWFFLSEGYQGILGGLVMGAIPAVAIHILADIQFPIAIALCSAPLLSWLIYSENNTEIGELRCEIGFRKWRTVVQSFDKELLAQGKDALLLALKDRIELKKLEKEDLPDTLL